MKFAASMLSRVPLIVLLNIGSLVACSSDEGGGSPDGDEGISGSPRSDGGTGGPSPDGAGGTGNGNSGPDGGAHSEGGSDGGVSMPVRPPVPVVASISGFAAVGGAASLTDLACNTAGCFEAQVGPASSGVLLLPHAAASPSTMPDGPFLVGLTTVGTTVYGVAFDYVSQAESYASVYKLPYGAAGWIRVGTKDPLLAWPPSSLETDGVRIYRPARNGLAAIGVGAGPGDAWSPVGTGFPGSAMHCRIDSKGNIYALSDQTMKEVFKLPVGHSAWAQLPMGAAMPQDEYDRASGRRISIAPNDDVWMVGANFVSKLPAGSSVWKRIFTGPSPADTTEHAVSEVIVDGSDRAYFTFGANPAKLYKVEPGASSPVDTGISVPPAPTLISGHVGASLGIDANGKLLVAMRGGSIYASGLYRSTP